MAKATKAKTAPKKSASAEITAARKARKNDAAGKRDYAFRLFMDRTPQWEIAERCEVSMQSISAWKKADNWDLKRDASHISPDSLILSAMSRANEILKDPKFNADSFIKTMASLRELRKDHITVDVFQQVFLIFSRWLDSQLNTDPNIDPAFVMKVTVIQDAFMRSKISNIHA